MDKEFSFKELDLEGMETLEAMAEAPRLNEWMYQTISSHLNGRILEIGSGIGNISACFLNDNKNIHLTDIRQNYVSYLKQQFKGNQNLIGIDYLDLVHPQFEEQYADMLGTYDGLFALNVVEHIQDDTLAIANCKKLLKSGGRLVILVPAYMNLYNGFDKELEHYRRYNRQTLSQLFESNQLEIKHSQYFNFVGIFGWYFSGNILKKKIIPKGQMTLYNKLVPIFKIIDKIVFNRMGLSIIVEGIKK